MRLRRIDVLQTTSTIGFRIGLKSHRLVWVQTTLSEYAKRLARENPAERNDNLDAYRQKITDPPEAFILNRVDNEQHARELLIHAASLYNFIVLDEAARMPESLSLIPMAKCPEASFLFVGDKKQFGPVVTTLD
ncbi:AAA domain-containing protein, partial [Fusarium mundagurra]